MNQFDLLGHKALITGATKGIGKATVALFLELGAEVLAVARTKADLEELAAGFSEASNNLYTCSADVATPEGRTEIVEVARASFGESLSTLVNNVGTNIRKETDNYPLEDLHRLMAVNTDAAFELCKAFRQNLSNTPNASIINVSSVSSINVVGTSTIGYAMSKGALDNMTRWLAVDWAKQGIRVNGVHPWYTKTELTKSLLENESLLKAVEQATPLKRCATTREVASAIAFLAMPAASYITGIQLPVDGGYLSLGLSNI